MRIEVPARAVGEPRWLVVGRMGGKHWSAVVTDREDRIRIIIRTSRIGSWSAGDRGLRCCRRD